MRIVSAVCNFVGCVATFVILAALVALLAGFVLDMALEWRLFLMKVVAGGFVIATAMAILLAIMPSDLLDTLPNK